MTAIGRLCEFDVVSRKPTVAIRWMDQRLLSDAYPPKDGPRPGAEAQIKDASRLLFGRYLPSHLALCMHRVLMVFVEIFYILDLQHCVTN